MAHVLVGSACLRPSGAGRASQLILASRHADLLRLRRCWSVSTPGDQTAQSPADVANHRPPGRPAHRRFASTPRGIPRNSGGQLRGTVRITPWGVAAEEPSVEESGRTVDPEPQNPPENPPERPHHVSHSLPHRSLRRSSPVARPRCLGDHRDVSLPAERVSRRAPDESFSLPGAESQRAADLIEERFPQETLYTSNVIFHSR